MSDEVLVGNFHLIGVETFCALAGVLAGFSFVFSGYHDPGEARSLVENPRMKSLTYVLGGGFLLTVPDWKIVSTDAKRSDLIIIYLEYSLITILALILIISIGMLFQLWAENRHRDHDKRLPYLPILINFLGYGFPAFFKAYSEAKEQTTPLRAANPYAVGQIMKSLHALMIAEEDYRSSPKLPARSLIVEQTMSAIVRCMTIILPPGKGVNLQANYMLAVKRDAPNAPEKATFYNTSLDGCSYLLIIEKYNDYNFTEHFVLPVHVDQNARLFGAPDAIALGRAISVNTSEINFSSRPKIPKDVAKQIEDYFAQKSYKSFFSIPVFSDNQVVGVVNIESDDSIFSQIDYELIDIAKSILPHTKVLACLFNHDSLRASK